jgi:hypothetical protein
MSKFVIAYAVLILAQVLVVNMFLAIPRPELLKFVAILIAPSLISGPLIYWSKRNSPKINAWLFIMAVEFHFICFVLGLSYVGTRLNYFSADTVRAVMPFVLLTSLITAGMLWKVSNRRTSALKERDNSS